jgi:hypothetical protein
LTVNLVSKQITMNVEIQFPSTPHHHSANG